MATITVISKKNTLIGGIGFDWSMAILGLCLIGGGFLDGWAHSHGRVDNTFFTPWHGVLYGSYLLCGATLMGVTLINYFRGGSVFTAIPRGYELSLLGAVLFMLAGVGDLIWHSLLGFETGIDPLLSPPHLLLGASSVLLISGPLRAAWGRTEETHHWSTLFPAVLSLIAFYSECTFFTEYAHYVPHMWYITEPPYSNLRAALGVTGILLGTAIFMGLLLFAMRRWRLPVGSITLFLGLNFSLMCVFEDQYAYIPVMLIPGIVADLLLWLLKPSALRLAALRLFAFGVPFVYFLTFFLALLLSRGITWSIHLWLGTVLLTGVLGYLLSFLVVPPAIPQEGKVS
jgi:hypothetical protein